MVSALVKEKRVTGKRSLNTRGCIYSYDKPFFCI